MRKLNAILAIFTILVIVMAPTATAEESFLTWFVNNMMGTKESNMVTGHSEEDYDLESALEDIEGAADKINEWIEKYKKAEIDIVKQEVVTIKDTEGNPVSCTFRAYYDNYNQAELTTGEDGKFEGNFNHGKSMPLKLLSVRLSYCHCDFVSMTHETTFPGINEHLERIKEVLEEEVKDAATGKISELAEKGVKKIFEKLGKGALAGPFLAGVGWGAELGAPIGDYITKTINKIFEEVRREAGVYHEGTGDVAPFRPNINVKRARGGWGNFWGENPTIKNVYDITVRCSPSITDAPADKTWYPPEQLEPDEEVTTGGDGEVEEEKDEPIPETPEEKAAREKQEAEWREEWEEEQRKRDEERKQREEEERIRREKEEAERKAKEEMDRKRQELYEKCPMCDDIRKALQQAEDTLSDLNKEIYEKETKYSDLSYQKYKAGLDVEKAQRDFDSFDSPNQDYVESEGRRVTTTDLRLRDKAMQEAWERYTSGENTAQETEDFWNDFTQEDIDRMKKEIKDDLQKAIDDAKQKVEDLGKEMDDLQNEIDGLKQDRDDMEKKVEDLKKELEDCLEKCHEEPTDTTVITGQDSQSVCGSGKYVNEQNCKDECNYNEKCVYTGKVGADFCFECQRLCKDDEFVDDAAACQKACGQPCEFRSRQDTHCYKCIGGFKYEGYRDDLITEPLDSGGEDLIEIHPGEGDSYKTPDGLWIDIEPGGVPDTGEVKVDCDVVCGEQLSGYSANEGDVVNYISEYLNQFSCVSSAHVKRSDKETQGCYCYGLQPQISVDSTPPMCPADNPCQQEVQCGQTIECAYGDGGTATVSCDWSGWDVSIDGARPIIGMH